MAIPRIPPAWPVITLTYQDDGTVLLDDGHQVSHIIPRSDLSTQTLIANATVHACQNLGLDLCRVQGIFADTAYDMVVDADAGTLDAIPEPEAPRRNRRYVIVGAIIALSLGVTGAGAYWWAENSRVPKAPVATAPPTPDATQLPVFAPPGWDTYATWTTPAPTDQRPSPVLVDSVLVMTSGDQIRGIDPATGFTLWEKTTSFPIRFLHVTTIDHEPRVAATDGTTTLGLIDPDGKNFTAHDVPKGRGRVVLADSGIYVEFPGQRAYIFTLNTWELRMIPAGASIVTARGSDIVAVNLVTQNVWFLRSDKAELPEPVKLPTPSGVGSLTGILGISHDYVLSAWTDPTDSTTTVLSVHHVDDSLAFVGTHRVPNDAVNLTEFSSDGVLVTTGRVLMELSTVRTVVSPSGPLALAGGFGWSSNERASNRVRISLDGETVPMEPNAPVPLLIFPDGAAFVRGSSEGSQSAYYALVPREETQS
ncbi:hypothetical protein [Lysinibacter sp. HNR]|uniref:hypothetical protein n=1 Tax=Lysinibacter sp. HNR TaxID=3031408 RepID=UPI0024350732|nr:hypothetical protein [Lysinibacter sp. HNR]WGD37580.1 hypothetical protein FrondiHNR_01250 [Lysinibacter sp. HNR]